MATQGSCQGTSGLREVAQVPFLIDDFEVTTNNLCSAVKGDGQGRPRARMVTGRGDASVAPISVPRRAARACRAFSVLGPSAGQLSEAQGERCGQANRAGGTIGSQVGEGWSLRLALCPQAWAPT